MALYVQGTLAPMQTEESQSGVTGCPCHLPLQPLGSGAEGKPSPAVLVRAEPVDGLWVQRARGWSLNSTMPDWPWPYFSSCAMAQTHTPVPLEHLKKHLKKQSEDLDLHWLGIC